MLVLILTGVWAAGVAVMLGYGLNRDDETIAIWAVIWPFLPVLYPLYRLGARLAR